MTAAVGESNRRDRDICMMFTDIEGSTRLLQSVGARYPKVLARHYDILSTAIARHDGHLVNTAGDAVFAVFADPAAGLQAAIDAQQALHDEPWPDGCEVRVRIGLHAGAVQTFGDDFVGLELHRAARIGASAHGGQIVLSREVQSRVPEKALPKGVRFRDLGSHRLKDLRYPERIYDLAVAGLPDAFPPLRSLGTRRTNLPADPIDLVGRVAETAHVGELLTQDRCRLVTLTGPGGTGKTSLAMAVAQSVQGDFAGGAQWVQLGEIRDADLVASAVAQSLGPLDIPGQSPAEVICKAIADAAFLLVLDTFEHVIDAARLLPELLNGCPHLSILVTSREVLGLRPEVVFQVPPLATPAADDLIEAIGSSDAVTLFVARVRDKRPAFALTPANAEPIARICRRLDGLPLAIELAAAHGGLLDPDALEKHLSEGLDFLRDERRDLDPRHRALRQTIAWSDALLSAPERRLLRCCAVFSGGFDIEAAEAVMRSLKNVDPDVLAGLESLVAKSLLQRGTALGRPRLRMLDTIREYAHDGLAAGLDHDAVLAGHAAYFEAVAAAAAPHVLGEGQRPYVERLFLEAGNIRAALAWALQQPDGEATARLLEHLRWYWLSHGPGAEAQEWTRRALEQTKDLGDTRPRAVALDLACWARANSAGFADALEPALESLRIYRALGDRSGAAGVGMVAGSSMVYAGQVADGMALLHETRALCRTLGDVHREALVLTGIGDMERMMGNVTASETHHDDALALLRETDDTIYRYINLCNKAHLRVLAGDWRNASDHASEALAICEAYDYPMHLVYAVMAKAAVALAKGEMRQAARIFGAGQARMDRLGLRFEPSDLMQYERYRATARDTLGDAAFEAATRAGATLPWDEAVAEARAI